jgi:hypothetical protein
VRINCQLLAVGMLYMMPLPSRAQVVEPYAKSEVKADWVRGTDVWQESPMTSSNSVSQSLSGMAETQF